MIKHVTADDGIDRSEADAIARAYFLYHVGCGVYQSLSDGKERWVVHGLEGVAGLPIKGFFIDKDTGAITSSVGPSYADFTAMHD